MLTWMGKELAHYSVLFTLPKAEPIDWIMMPAFPFRDHPARGDHPLGLQI